MAIEHRVSIPGGTRIYTVGYQLHLDTNGLLLPALDRWDGKAPIRDTIDAARYAWAGKATAYDAMLAHVTGADVDQLASPEAQP